MEEQNIRAIRITTSHCLGGGRGDAWEGMILHIPEDLKLDEAKRKIAMGFAVAVSEEKHATEEPASDATPALVTQRDPAFESRDPEMTETPARPRRKRKPKS